MVEIPVHHLLWFNLEENELHRPFICHLMDAVHVTRTPWHAVLTDGTGGARGTSCAAGATDVVAAWLYNRQREQWRRRQ